MADPGAHPGSDVADPQKPDALVSSDPAAKPSALPDSGAAKPEAPRVATVAEPGEAPGRPDGLAAALAEPEAKPDALLSDRQRLWRGATRALLGVVITVALVLILLAMFLL